jgi:hypothetical protein
MRALGKEEPMIVQTVAIVSVLLITLLVSLKSQRRKRLDFEERFPPISDEEFVSRCAPGTNREIALKVRRIVADQLGVEYERIYPSSSFVNDLWAD